MNLKRRQYDAISREWLYTGTIIRKGGKMRDAGTVRERIFNALIQRYKADGEEALVKIDALLKGEVVPGHYALTEDIDKLLAKVADAEEKMATLRRHYGTN